MTGKLVLSFQMVVGIMLESGLYQFFMFAFLHTTTTIQMCSSMLWSVLVTYYKYAMDKHSFPMHQPSSLFTYLSSTNFMLTLSVE